MLRFSKTTLLIVLLIASAYLGASAPTSAQGTPEDSTICFISGFDSTTVANLDALHGGVQGATSLGGNPGARLKFPNRGRINALQIFVQFAVDSVEANPVSDLQTEWPATLSLGSGNPLPTWAGSMLAAPNTPPSNYTEGSLSHYYHLMSGGRFKLEGYVYPQVYIPDHDPDWYIDNNGTFANAQIRLSHEILSHVAANPQGIPFNDLDRWQNGNPDATDFLPDDRIDMIIISYRSTVGKGDYFRQISSLGSCHPSPSPSPCLAEDQDAFASAPIFFGTKQVIDNPNNGSGVIAGSQSVAGMANIVAHELGHRQFHFGHEVGSTQDIFSAMKGWPAGHLSTMSLGDRVQLGWVTLDTLDVSALSRQTISLDDTFEGGRALYIKDGAPNQGDVYIEARTQSNFWDRPPDGQNYDFDDIAIYLEDPGLMVYKRNNSGSQFSSMERTRLAGRESYWELTQCCFPNAGADVFFEPGSMLSPFSVYRFGIYAGDVSDVFALTDVTETATGYSFDVWGNYPAIDTEGVKVVSEVSSLSNNSAYQNLARNRLWTLGGSFVFTDSLYAAPSISTSSSFPNIISLEERALLEVGSFTVAGTASYPVVFKRATPAEAWDRILLKGTADSGHTLDHVRIEGAQVGLDIRTTSVDPRMFGAYVSNAELVDNGIGISTDYTISINKTERARVSLWNVLVEGSDTYGLYLRNADFALLESTVRYSDGHGVYVKNATAETFAENVIEDNGGTSSTNDGLRLEANGSVDFSRRGDIVGSGQPALNRIAGNADKQVVYLSGGYLFMGNALYGGDQNAVLGTGMACRVYNSSGSSLEAENTYWGTTTTPPSSYFCGGSAVDYIPYLTSDPTIVSRPDSGSPPLYVAAVMEDPAEQRGEEGDQEPAVWLRERIRAVRAEVAGNPSSADAPTLVRLLAGLHRLDPRDRTGEGPASQQALRRLRDRLTQEAPANLPPALRRTAESALVVAVESALAAGEIEQADNLLTAFEPLIEGEAQALTLELDAVAVDEALGRYDSALTRLSGLIASVGDGHDGLGADLAFMAEVIAAKAEGESAGRGAGTIASIDDQSKVGVDLPAEFALHAAYPNPTATRAMVPFSLPTAADVRIEVYDLLGRRVAVLADGQYEAGRHLPVLDASGLGSGVYLVRSLFAAPDGAHVFTQKLTLIR